MSATRHLSLVVDEVLADAATSARRRADEVQAVKTAEVQPRTEVARGLRALAANLRDDSIDVGYADLPGSR